MTTDEIIEQYISENPDVSGLFGYMPMEEARGKVEEEIGPYYDKTLEMALETLGISKKRTEEAFETGKGRQAVEEERFYKAEDRSFAQALKRTQQRFSGKELGTTGMRWGETERKFGEREVGLEGARIGFEQTAEDRQRTFSQALEDIGRGEETTKFHMGMEKEMAILTNIPRVQEAGRKERAGKLAVLGTLEPSRLQQALA